MMDWVYASLGLIILLLAGDSLVRGAVNLALRVGIPALIVSLTIVAFGTSAPELLIAIRAVFDDAAGIAMGNVVGSNTANVLLVLGFPALLAAMHEERGVLDYEAQIFDLRNAGEMVMRPWPDRAAERAGRGA